MRIKTHCNRKRIIRCPFKIDLLKKKIPYTNQPKEQKEEIKSTERSIKGKKEANPKAQKTNHSMQREINRILFCIKENQR